MKKVSDIIIQNRQKYKKIFLAGFSIGATITWLCSSRKTVCEGLVCYYDSRIRNYTDVMKTAEVLRKTANVKGHVLPGRHGFSDPFSGKYCEKSAKEALKLADNFFIGK